MLVGAISATLPGGSIARFAGTVVAVLVAFGVARGLGAVESAIRPDPAFDEMLTPLRDRPVADELAEWAAQQPHATAAEREAEAHLLAEAHEDTFPFGAVLGCAIIAALLAGGLLSPRRPYAPIESRLLARAAIAMVTASTAMIVISQLVPS
jgi:hypothetical protein